MGRRRGRPRKSADQKLKDALERALPNARVLELRRLFSFVQQPPESRLDGRNGEVDSEVCDAIGQLCALGLLSGHGHDPVEMRDKGRFWGCHYAKLMKSVGVKSGAYERRSRSEPTNALTGADLMFDRMDEALPRYERQVLLSLLVDPLIGHEETVPWAKSLIDEALLERKRLPHNQATIFPTAYERGLLEAAIRGLVCLIDGALAPRWAA